MKKALSIFLSIVILVCSFSVAGTAQAATKAPKQMSVSSAVFYYDLLRKSCHTTIKWKKQKGVSGYQIKLGIELDIKPEYVKTKTIKGSKTTVYKIYGDYDDFSKQYTAVKIRAYKKDKKGKKIYGKWSKEYLAKFKTLNELKGFKGKVLSRSDESDRTLKLKLTWKKVKGAEGYQIVYRDYKNYYKTTRVYVKGNKTSYTGWFKEVGEVRIRPYRIVKGERKYGAFANKTLDYTPDL